MALWVVPEGLTAASAAVEAITARLGAAHTAAASVVSAVAPPGADEVSLRTALGFSELGMQHAAVASQGVEELGRAGIGVAESGSSYAVGDAEAAAGYGFLGS